MKNGSQDLDIELEARPGIFEAFGADAEGHLSVSELVQGLMRLRGDLQKSDIVPWRPKSCHFETERPRFLMVLEISDYIDLS